MNDRSSSPNLRNAYTDSPELHRNLLLGGLQVLFWLFFHPSAWHNHVKRIDPTLRPDVALAELHGKHWRNPVLQRTLLMAYGVLPFLLVVILAGVSPVVFDEVVFSVSDVTGGVVFGLVFGLMFGVTGGIAFGVAGGVAGGVAFGVIGGVTGDVAFGVATGAAGGVLGVVFGVAGSVTSQEGGSIFKVRQVRGIFVSIIISGVVFGVEIVMLGVVMFLLTIGGLVEDVIGVAMLSVAFGVAHGVMFGAAVGVRTRSWPRATALGLVFGMLAVALGVAGGVAFSVLDMVPVAGEDILGVVTDVAFVGVGTGVAFAFPYTIAERIAGPVAGAVTGAFVNVWVFGAPFGSTVLSTMLGLFVVIVAGLTLSLWRPILLYPVETAWNLLLYRVDKQRAAEQPSLFRWHAAFWDEHQHLPLVGLEEHLMLVLERNPSEGQRAIEYLATSSQRWAAQQAVN